MIRVVSHGEPVIATNKFTGVETMMIPVVFVEAGRNGGNKSTQALSKITGKSVGLSSDRTCTIAVTEEQLGDFPVGAEFPLHLNRTVMDTNPYPKNDSEPREYTDVNGKTHMVWFKTEIAESVQGDVFSFVLEDAPTNNVPLKTEALLNAPIVP